MLEKHGVDSKYLDLTALELGHSYTKVALVQSVRTGVSRLDTGFFTFYLKDINANILGARLFNIDDYVSKGFVANSLKGKFVRVTFTAQEFNGSISLLVQEINEYDGDVERSKFVGAIPKVDISLNYTNSVLTQFIGQEVKLPERYLYESLNTVSGGKAGGYANLIALVTSSVAGYFTLTEDMGMANKHFAFVLYKSIVHYNQYLKRKNEIDIITNKEIIGILSGIKESQSSELNAIIIDTLSALMGLGKPEHLFSNIIFNAFRTVETNLELLEIWNTVPTGFVKKVGDSVLVRY